MNNRIDEQKTFFINRLKKNAKQLRKWANKNNYDSVRLYDKDIPEIPLIVEKHRKGLVIWDRRSFTDGDPAERAAWLKTMAAAAMEALEISPEMLFVKERRRQKGSSQYDKLNKKHREFVVQEGPLKFIVNLSDYLDTGLFLDHRPTREMVMSEARGKDVLNLFAYTGSFSLYARQGGAASTTTVDLSATYLEWAERNFEQNNLMTERDRFIREDILQYLPSAARVEQRFDIIVLDPPTFSNSARMHDTLDIQRDHQLLLDGCLNLLKPEGVVYFSTNNRKFKFEARLPEGVEVREITAQTIPMDFRDKKIHRCWKIKRS